MIHSTFGNQTMQHSLAILSESRTETKSQQIYSLQNLVFSPLKTESISRLVGCVLAVRLTAAVQETYPANVENTFYWTDSQVCLCWINYTAKSLKPMLHTVLEKYTAHWEPRRCWYSINFCRGPKRVRTLVKRTCISQETNRTMAKDKCGQETWNNRIEVDYLHINYVAHSRIYCWPLETFASKSLLN